MQKINIIKAIIILFTFFESCNSVEPEEVLAIDSTIKFRIYESYPETYDNNIGDPKISLKLFTEKEYPCLGYQLNINQTISEKDIFIDILSVSVPSICPAAFGPADSYLLLDLPNGEYNLKLKVGRRIDNYLVSVTNSDISIKIIQSEISEPVYDKYFRYPQKSFAYYCGTSIANQYICEDFLDTLKSKIIVQEFAFPENGQKPYPDSLGGHYYEMVKFFYYEAETDFDKIGDIISDYKKTVLKNDEANISIYNWQNKYFYSWLL